MLACGLKLNGKVIFWIHLSMYWLWWFIHAKIVVQRSLQLFIKHLWTTASVSTREYYCLYIIIWGIFGKIQGMQDSSRHKEKAWTISTKILNSQEKYQLQCKETLWNIWTEVRCWTCTHTKIQFRWDWDFYAGGVILCGIWKSFADYFHPYCT